MNWWILNKNSPPGYYGIDGYFHYSFILPEINHQIPDFVINNIDLIDFVQYLNEMDPIYLVKENEIALAGKFDGQKLEVFRNNHQRKEEWFVGTKGQVLDNLIIVLPVKTKHILDILMIMDIIE